VEKKPTTWAVASLVAISVGMAILSRGGVDPDPRALDMARGMPLGEVEPAGPRLVVASLAMPAMTVPQAAPQAEMAPREAEPGRSRAAIVVGHTAVQAIDAKLQMAFAEFSGCGDTKPMLCSDRDAVETMQLGRADFAIIGGNVSARDHQAGLRGTRIGVELFALAVAPQSPLRSLTHQQVRQVFTGQVQRWSQLGLEGGAIVTVVPSDRAMVERAAKTLIPGDAFASTCLGVASEQHVADQILREPGAIGIVCVTGRPLVPGMRLLQIDWTTPSADAFGYGTYPFGIAVTLVTSGQPTGIAADFLRFARGDGRDLLAHSLLPLP
jgi:ABC-type phosphate transport system substrate-binding protein